MGNTTFWGEDWSENRGGKKGSESDGKGKDKSNTSGGIERSESKKQTGQEVTQYSLNTDKPFYVGIIFNTRDV